MYLKILGKISFLSIVFLLLSCNKVELDNDNQNNDYDYICFEMEYNSQVLDFNRDSKAHYIQNKDNNNLSFEWDNDVAMYSIVAGVNNNLRSWDNNKYFSNLKIKVNNSNKKLATFETKQKISNLTSGDVLYSISTNESMSVDNNNNIVTFSLPNAFNQSVNNSLEHLKDYTYLFLKSTISNSQGKIVLNKTEFNNVNSILRFRLTNLLPKEIKVKSIKIEAKKASAPANIFPNKVAFSVNNSNMVENNSTSTSGYYNSIELVANNITLPVNEVANMYVYVFPVLDSGTLQDTEFLITVIDSDNNIYEFNKGKLDFGEPSNAMFKPGYVYTFKLDVKTNDIVDNEDYKTKYFDSYPNRTDFAGNLMLFKFTSTACVYCPPYTTALNDALNSTLKDSVLFVEMHCRMKGTYDCDEAYTLSRYIIPSSGGIPYLNPNFYPNWSIKPPMESMRREIRHFIKNYCPMFGKVGLSASVKNNSGSLDIKLYVKSGLDKEDQFSATAFLMEDVGGYHNVFRKSSISSPSKLEDFYGTLMTNSDNAKYKTCNLSITNLSKEWNLKNCKVLVYITSKVDYGGINVVNAIVCDIDGITEFKYR